MKSSNTRADIEERIAALKAELAALEKRAATATRVNTAAPTSITVKTEKSQARFVRVRRKGAEDVATGKFYMELAITAGSKDVFIPLSIASGKKVAGFMYQIEGTAAASIVTTELKVQGEQVSHVTLGTLRFARIPAGTKALFSLQIEIKGKFGKTYRIVFVRLNYKHDLKETRYQQYRNEIPSKSVTFK